MPGEEASQDTQSSTSTQTGTDTGNGAIGCTEEARVVCVQKAPGVYEQSGVGRTGPNCEFEEVPNEVDGALCMPQTGGACTDDAKVVCVESAPGVYERRGVGREGATCAFPKVEGEVDDAKCGDYASDTMACKELEAKVELELDHVRACDADADCDVRSGSCPFGCYQAVNPKLATAKLEAATKAFTTASCASCDYDCDEKPDSSRVHCVEHRCVIDSTSP
jgi:hypothetical protein